MIDSKSHKSEYRKDIFFEFWKNERKSLDNVDIRDKASTTIVSFEWK